MEAPIKTPFTPLDSGMLKIGFLFYWVYSTKTTVIPFFICSVCYQSWLDLKVTLNQTWALWMTCTHEDIQ